ncbi:MAG: zf-HC2 domain-containing protein [Eubacterium sp.]|nr:zf-HC2 domain-containing protein [Eubacterium sp.]
MKYELPCEVVKDLLPLHIDALTSENVAESMEAHMLTCSDCRKEYDDMKNTNDIQIQAKADKSLMKKAKKRFSKKLALIGLIIAIVTSVATLTGVAAVYKYGDVIRSEEINAIVTEIDFDELDFNDKKTEFTYKGKQYPTSEAEYAQGKENGNVQQIHLNTKYTSDRMGATGFEINGEYIYFVSVTSDGEIANESEESRNGWNWVQVARPIDKIVYINSKDGILSENAEDYKIIWEKEKSLSVPEIVETLKKIQAERDEMGEPKLLWKSDKVYGEEKVYPQIEYWKDFNDEMDELQYALFIKLKNPGDSSVGGSGIFVDYNHFINDKLTYNFDDYGNCDVSYNADVTKTECYYCSIVPSDCAYAEIEGQRLYPQKTTINIEGVNYPVTYICGVVDNISGVIYDDGQGRVTLFDNKGNAHMDNRPNR